MAKHQEASIIFVTTRQRLGTQRMPVPCCIIAFRLEDNLAGGSGDHYSAHFRDEETEAQTLYKVNRRVGTHTQACLTSSLSLPSVPPRAPGCWAYRLITPLGGFLAGERRQTGPVGLVQRLGLRPESSPQGLKLPQPLYPRDSYSCLRPRESGAVCGAG